jgi:uncharacterized repeat protein (TIGR03806 family)
MLRLLPRHTFPFFVALPALFSACATPQEDEGAEQVSQPVSACVAGARPSVGVKLERVHASVAFAAPLVAAQAPGSDAWYVVEKGGTVKRVAAGAASATTFADLRSRVNAGPNEAGLLGMAFHPRFAQNGLVFFSYTRPSAASPANLRSVIARAKSLDGGQTISTSTITEIFGVEQPYSNHNGGGLEFGGDGMLYLGLGDGGSGGDPQGNAQNTNSLLGKMLRIDVDRGSTYAIPLDNPFANGGGRPEIFAWGLRNPWRFSFDRQTGDLWAGDVGQNKWEEIDRVVRGGNYGWKLREGRECYAQPCTAPGLIDPIVVYGRSEGIAVTGGYVYRGAELPDLQGRYVYGDFGSGKIWSIPTTGPGAAAPTPKLVADSGLNLGAFAEGHDGELYALDLVRGQIFKLAPDAAQSVIPDKLSQTGCFAAAAPLAALTPRGSLVPYDVRSPLWSDGAIKSRWLSVPAGKKIRVGADGDWDLPVGTVLVKSFAVGGAPVETRLFVRHTDGVWAGYSYEWNAQGTDATLLEGGKTKVIGGQTWTFPSRGQCRGCHTEAAGATLGPETAQLDRDYTYPGGLTENQLTHLARLGLFDPATPLPAPAARTPLPVPGDATTGTVEARARSYLHANCSFCHRPDGPGRSGADLRFSRSFRDTGLCDTAPEAGDLGVAGAKLIAPGSPSRSLVSLRMHATNGARMPALGTEIVDPVGTSVVDGWINGLTRCP